MSGVGCAISRTTRTGNAPSFARPCARWTLRDDGVTPPTRPELRRGERVDPVADGFEVHLGCRGSAGDADPGLAADPGGVLRLELVRVLDMEHLVAHLAALQ